MGRQRDFSEAEVLNAVADVFVAHGYKGTSMQMLIDASGLGKQSLYNTFGDKRAIYLQAMDCATQRYSAVAEKMAQADTGRAAIDFYFDHLVTQCMHEDPSLRSCIVASGLLEGIDDDAVSGALNEKWCASHAMLRLQVVRGLRDGSIASAQSATELTDYLMSLTSGLRVSARAVTDKKRLKRIVQSGLKILDTT
jgi:TetR/AcrR family transcriptional regulator, transcriptional repressor for nem operon